jgi:hypothetical protein
LVLKRPKGELIWRDGQRVRSADLGAQTPGVWDATALEVLVEVTRVVGFTEEVMLEEAEVVGLTLLVEETTELELEVLIAEEELVVEATTEEDDVGAAMELLEDTTVVVVVAAA